MAQALSSRTWQEKTSLLMDRDYRLLWIGQTLSLTGDAFFSATIAIWIIDRLAWGASWLPLAFGGVALAVALSSLLVCPSLFSSQEKKKRVRGERKEDQRNEKECETQSLPWV